MTKKQEEQTKSQVALKWRLGSKPTLDDVERMLDKKIIDNEEARQILFSLEEKASASEIDSLKQEVELLRELVMTLSRNPQTVTIKEIVRDRNIGSPWHKPYEIWCNALPNHGMFTMLDTGNTGGGYINHTVISGGKVDHSSKIMDSSQFID